MKRLEDRVAIITGSGKGIGRALTLGMVREGALAVIADIDSARAFKVQEELEKAGHRAFAIPTDVSSEESVKGLVRKCMDKFSRIDILVNSAAIDSICSVEIMAEEEWDRVVGVNLVGTFLCSKAVVPKLLDQRKGRIINFASGRALMGGKDASHYAASKAGVIGFTKALGLELAPNGITVNAICPGDITGDVKSGLNPPDPIGHEDKVIFKPKTECIPLGRKAQPEDLVGPAIFLASDAAEYVTGQTLLVNGGDLVV